MKFWDQVSLIRLRRKLRRRQKHLVFDDIGLKLFQPRLLLYKLMLTRLERTVEGCCLTMSPAEQNCKQPASGIARVISRTQDLLSAWS